MEKIKIGFVGLKFGKTLLTRLAAGVGNDFFEIAAVCDIDKFKADDVASRYPGCDSYYDIDELLKRDDIPVIGLFTGPAGRASLLKKIIDAGKDVMTTKPFEIDSDEAKNILAYAKEKDRIIHLNSPSPVYDAYLQKVNDWQKEFGLGRIVACRAELWTSHREKPDGTWHDDPKLCPVAPITRIGIYKINEMLKIMGKPVLLSTMQSRIFTERPTPDNAQLMMLFENGSIASIFASYCCKHPSDKKFAQHVTINYENGTIYCNVLAEKLMTLKLMGFDKENNPVIKETEVHEGSAVYQWEYLYNAVKDRTLNSDEYNEEIVTGIKMLEAVAKSEFTNESIEITY